MSDVLKMCSRLGDGAARAVLQATLTELDGFWLEFRCGCGRVTTPPVRLVIGRLGRERRLHDIIARATCRRCGARPAFAYLNETPDRGRADGAFGFSVRLIPRPCLADRQAAE